MPDSNSSSSGGLIGTPTSSGTIGGLMGINDPDLMVSVGLGLMSAAKFQGNVGDALQGALSGYAQRKLQQQQYQQGQFNLQMQQARMPALNAYFQQLPGLFGVGQTGSAASQPQPEHRLPARLLRRYLAPQGQGRPLRKPLPRPKAAVLILSPDAHGRLRFRRGCSWCL